MSCAQLPQIQDLPSPRATSRIPHLTVPARPPCHLATLPFRALRISLVLQLELHYTLTMCMCKSRALWGLSCHLA